MFADTLDQAKDAAEKLAIEWEPLPAITETRRATDQERAAGLDEAPNNICFVFEAGNKAAVEPRHG